MNSRISTTAPDLIEEINALSTLYTIDRHGMEQFLYQADLSHYAEYVLGTNTLEIVTGGVGYAGQLTDLAASRQVPRQLLKAFEACDRAFPGKMAYYKQPFGEGAAQPTLYLNMLEPWARVLDFLENTPGLAAHMPALRAHTRHSHMCVMLGFSWDDAAGQLLLKTYQLADREQTAEHSPLLVSHRFSTGGAVPDIRYYKDISWQEMDDLFPARHETTTLARTSLGDAYRTLLGYSYNDADGHSAPKVYVFRKDARRKSSHSKNSSLYTIEGDLLLAAGNFHEAINSYTTALALNDSDYQATTNRGFCYAILGEEHNAVKDAEAAQAIEPDMNFRQARQYIAYVKDIGELASKLQTKPEAGDHNRFGIIFFNHGLFADARHHFTQATRLDSGFAEAYNNLAGACINLQQFSEAFSYAGKAISLDENTDTTNYLLALRNLHTERQT